MATCFPLHSAARGAVGIGSPIVSGDVPDGAGTTAAVRVRHEDFYAVPTSASILINARFIILKPMAQLMLQLHHHHQTQMRPFEPFKKHLSSPARALDTTFAAPRLHRLSLWQQGCSRLQVVTSKLQDIWHACAPSICALLSDCCVPAMCRGADSEASPRARCTLSRHFLHPQAVCWLCACNEESHATLAQARVWRRQAR